MPPLISVIIPTYNREKFLPYALKSVKNQTYKNWELIIIDDGSTDNTKKLCLDFAKSVKQPVKYIYQENKGAAAARNTGLKIAQGDFVAFLDSDDRWYPWHLKKCLKAFEIENDLDFVFAAGRKFDFYTGESLVRHNFYINNKPHPILVSDIITQKNKLFIINNNKYSIKIILEHGLPSGLQCMCFKREAIQNEYFDPELRIAEDRHFIFRLFLKGKKCAFWLSVNTLRFVHDSHLSGEKTESPEKLEFIAYNLIKAYKRLISYTTSNQERKIISNKIFKYYIDYLIPALEKQKKKEKIKKESLKALKYNPLSLRIYKTILTSCLNV